MATAPSPAAPRFKPGPPNAPPVHIRLLTGQAYPVVIDANFDQFAAEAVDALRNRTQWRSVASARSKMAEACRGYLRYLKLDAEEQLKNIAAASVIEVEIPLACGESAFAFPWEFAISEATASLRSSEALLVVRRLSGGQAGTGLGAGVASGLVVQSAPANLAAAYTFESEEKLVTSSLPGIGMTTAIGLTAAQLKSQIELESPNFIHFAGIDGLQGSALLKWPETKWAPGMFFPDDNGMAAIVDPETLATAAASGKNGKPALVSYNIYNSSWPLACSTVAKGAAAAIGFQDEIDDSVAELFFARFYEAWQSSGWNLLAAYRAAWDGLRADNSKLLGTGIILWSAHSLIKVVPSTGTGGSAGETILDSKKCTDLRSAISVMITRHDRLNYSMMHNDRPLFEKFEVKRQSAGRLLGIRVDITLQAGTEKAEYSTVFDLGKSVPLVDVNKRARVPLTSDMLRSVRESVCSSLFVSVKWEDRVVYQDTFRVSLLPPDEWRDDDLNRVWLPSFVLPRDPVISKLIDNAQKFLTALADESSAGFDGYQGVRPQGKIEDCCESVDQQVYALWWSLIQDQALGYINPPPSFTARSQRLRSPSDIVAGRRGTCIDLALLMAALLEYIDIHPVIFLLRGHAFPGYWRSEESYARLGWNPIASADGAASQYAWMLDRNSYSDLLQLVRDGHLVPIESVALTQRSGYWDAVAQGIENLRSRDEFEFLIDIKRAREANVTPIPLWSIHT
jgi:hypothetical protein